MARLIWVFILLAALAGATSEAADEQVAIIAATKSYVATNSGMTQFTVTVE